MLTKLHSPSRRSSTTKAPGSRAAPADTSRKLEQRSLFDYTSYFVTVGLSNTMQLRLLGNYSVMLELLESLCVA